MEPTKLSSWADLVRQLDESLRSVRADIQAREQLRHASGERRAELLHVLHEEEARAGRGDGAGSA
jgi:hypothetical protein